MHYRRKKMGPKGNVARGLKPSAPSGLRLEVVPDSWHSEWPGSRCCLAQREASLMNAESSIRL